MIQLASSATIGAELVVPTSRGDAGGRPTRRRQSRRRSLRTSAAPAEQIADYVRGAGASDRSSVRGQGKSRILVSCAWVSRSTTSSRATSISGCGWWSGRSAIRSLQPWPRRWSFRVAPLSGLVRSSRTDVAVDHRRSISCGPGRPGPHRHRRWPSLPSQGNVYLGRSRVRDRQYLVLPIPARSRLPARRADRR